MATEDTGNLDIQRQINELLEARTVLMSKQNEVLRNQIQISEKLAELLDKGSKKPEGVDNMAAALTAAADAARSASTGIEGVTAAATEAAREIPNVGPAATQAAKAGRTAFQKFKDVLGGVVGVVTSLTRSIIGIGGALLSIPMGILSSLQEEAANLANDSLVLRTAFEEVRDKFGSLASNEGKAVIDSYKELNKQSGNLAGSGRSLGSIYGYGPDGLAKAMQELSETAEAMGPVFSALGNQMVENAAQVVIYQKGLGITNEAMKSLGSTALARGENITDSLKEIGNLSVQMGKKFGISSKLMGKDMTYMTSNMGKFGAMTKAQMATSAVYVRKLGLEIKDLEGLMGAFDDFETAATNASKLAQSFGMNVDAMQMMKEQDPSKRLDMLRQSFAATGRSIKDMSRAEKDLLAQTAGMDANMVEAALSAENMGMSYDEISAAAEGAADKQLSQEEIMQNMADNIKKAFEPIQYLGSLFKTFFDGFTNGIMKAKPMKELLYSIMDALKSAARLGRVLGNVFVTAFPGVKEMLGGVAGFFRDISKTLDGITKDVKNFKNGVDGTFKDFQKNPEKYINKFTDYISNAFKKIFGDKNGRGSTILDGMMKFGSFLLKSLIALLPKLLSGLTDIIKKLAAWIRGMNAGSSLLKPLIDGIMDVLPDLLHALWDLFVEAFKALSPILVPVIGAYIGFMLLKATISAISSAVVLKIKSKIADAIGVKPGEEKQPVPISEKMREAAKSVMGIVEELGNVKPGTVAKAGLNLLIIAAFVSGAVYAFSLAISESAALFAGISWDQVNMVFISMALGISATLGLAFAASALSEAIPEMLIGILGLTVAALFVIDGILWFSIAVRMAADILKPVDWDDIKKVFAATGFGILATIVLAFTAASLVADGGATLTIGMAGLLLAAIFTTAGIVVFSKAVAYAAGVLKEVDWDDIKKVFAATATGIGALIGIAVASIALATAAPAMALGLVTLPLAVAFLTFGVAVLAAGINSLITRTNIADPSKVLKIFELILVSMTAVGALVAASGTFALMGPYIIPLIASTLLMAKFMEETSGSLARGLSAIDRINVTDPEQLKLKVELIGKLVESMSSLGTLAVDAGKLDIASKIFKGNSASSAIESMGSFLEKIKGKITGLLTTVMTIALDTQKYPKGVISRAVGVADVIGKIANLAGALTQPISALAGIKGGLALGNRATEIIDFIMVRFTQLLPVLSKAIQDIIPEVFKTAKLIPPGFNKEKADAFASAIGAVASLVTAISSPIQALAGIEGGGILMGNRATDKIDQIMKSMGTIMETIKTELPYIVDSVVLAADGLPDDFNNEKAQTIATVIGTIKPVAESLGEIMKLSEGKALDAVLIKKNIDSLRAPLANLAGFMPDYFKVSDMLSTYKEKTMAPLVTAIVDDIKAVNSALESLGDIQMDATVEKIGKNLGIKDSIIQLERKPITMNVQLNLTMKADDIAKEIFDVSAKMINANPNDPSIKNIAAAFGAQGK